MARKLYPRSFLRLILLGFLLVSLPLVSAVGYTVFAVDRLARDSAVAVQRSAAVARTAKQLAESLTGIERVLRQYLVLKDTDLLEDYRALRAEFRQTLGELETFLVQAEHQSLLASVLAEEDALNSVLVQQTVVDPEEILQRFATMVNGADGLVVLVRNNMDEEVSAMLQSALSARDQLTWLLPITLPLALVIALWFRNVISTQIAQFDQAIRHLGRGDYVHPIEVEGPEDLAALGQRLDWLRQRLGELEQQKTRFLRHVSHDLKTPLTAIREGGQLLDDGVPGPLTEQQRSVVAIMRQNSLRLQGLIEELLNFQQASQSAASLDLQPVALEKVCDNVVADHLLAAAARGVRLQRMLPPVQVEGDPDKLRVVVDNLITNALKFSPRDGVVRILLGAEAGMAVLDVIDDGPGIDPAERERIFEPFFRGTRADQVPVEGSGLGLAIAQEYVLAHHGKIELINSDTGAHFRVSLPKVRRDRLA